jgi:hypothetical protein
MGFNRRKKEDQRRQAAEKEAAERRAILRTLSVTWPIGFGGMP